MENESQTDDFVLTAEVQDYLTDSDTFLDAGIESEPQTSSPDEPIVVIDDGLVDVTELMPEVQEDVQEAPQTTQIGDGLYLDANGQGLGAALAAYQEAVLEGVDFTTEGSGTWYYGGGMFSFAPA